MKEVFQSINQLLENAVPREMKYIFKEKFETKTTYEFILLIEKINVSFFGQTNNEGLIAAILKIANSKISKFDKEIIIEIEVFEDYAW